MVEMVGGDFGAEPGQLTRVLTGWGGVVEAGDYSTGG